MTPRCNLFKAKATELSPRALELKAPDQEEESGGCAGEEGGLGVR
jgi:hypothetical protein